VRTKHFITAAITMILLLFPMGWLLAQSSRGQGVNLISNPGFEEVNSTGKMPQDWTTFSPRAEISPAFELDSAKARTGRYSARIKSQGSPGTIGYWVKTLQLGNTVGSDPGDFPASLTLRGEDFLGTKSFHIRCYFRTEQVEEPTKNVWIRVRWQNGRNEELLAEYLTAWKREGDWICAEQVMTAPQSARSLKLELALLWTATGSVWWDDVTVEESALPTPRRIKIATVCFEPPYPSTPDANRRFFAMKVAEAGKAGADIICLGEGITLVSTGKNHVDVAETIPGPTTQILGEIARQYHIYVVVGIYERTGPIVYNTAILLDREGNVSGKYRKTHLPETEVTDGLTPGDSYPVFQTDFGTIGIEICYDYCFPEVTRSLAVNGAEIIFLPIWGDLRNFGNTWDIVARSRAIDNSIYLVASIYSNTRSLIINPIGRILADTGGVPGLVMAEVDLNARTFDRWLSVPGYGDWKGLYPRERRPETYSPLTKAR
jgi:predicted amidohydrolase